MTAGSTGGGRGRSGRHRTVDEVLRDLAAVGERERRAAEPVVLERIARAAALQRRSEAELEVGAAGLVPVGGSATGARPPRRRRRSVAILGVAAALLAAVAVGRALTGPPQIVVTDGEATLQPAGPGDAGPEAAAGRPTPPSPEAGDDRSPVLDLGDSTTTVPEAISADAVDPTPTTPPTTGPSTSDQPTSPTDGDPGPTATTTAATPAPSSPTTPPAAIPTNPAGSLTVAVGPAGSLALRLVDGRVDAVDVQAADGWQHSVTEPGPSALDIRLGDGSDEVAVLVRSTPTSFRLTVDDGGLGPPGMRGTRTWTVGSSGTVVLGYDGRGIRDLDVEVADGWGHRVSTVGEDHLEVVLLVPGQRGRHETGLTTGSLRLDLVVIGP